MDGASLFLGFVIGFVAAIVAVLVGIAIVSVGASEKREEIQK
jgi:hypothetical protein